VTNPGLLGGTLPNAFTVTGVAPSPGGVRIYMPLVIHKWPPTTTDVFGAIADTTVLQGFPNSYYGSEESMWAGYDPCWGGRIARSLIRFDLDRIPRGASVEKATLHLELILSCDHAPTSGPIGAFRIRDGWNSNTVTWNTQPSHAESIGQVTISTRNHRRYSMDVTGFVQGWANRNFPNLGIMLRGPEGSGGNSAVVGFATRNHQDGLKAANIEVTYRAPASRIAPEAAVPGPGIAPESAEPGDGGPPGALPGPPLGLFRAPVEE
jgi:hypothetical protein